MLRLTDILARAGMVPAVTWPAGSSWRPRAPASREEGEDRFMRRFAPDGVATCIMWTANVRALRHVIEARTAPGAEEEIRLVFAEVARTSSGRPRRCSAISPSSRTDPGYRNVQGLSSTAMAAKLGKIRRGHRWPGGAGAGRDRPLAGERGRLGIEHSVLLAAAPGTP